jgi:hypothetical protein
MSSLHDSLVPVHPYAQMHYDKDMVTHCILPNLIYKDKNIHFKLKNDINLKYNNKNHIIGSILLENIALNSTINFMDNIVNASIIEEELENGLKVKIEYQQKLIDIIHIQKIAKYIESLILNIDISDEIFNINQSDDSYNYEDLIRKKYYTEREKFSDSESNSEVKEDDHIKEDDFYDEEGDEIDEYI